MMDDELKARELGTSSFAAGVIQPVEDLRTQYSRLSQLYQREAISNTTRKNQLYTAMGLAPNQALPQGIKIPQGFEIEYKLVQHEDNVRFKFNQYLDGQMGYDTFLYEAYGRDILKTQGHDLKNPMYWYSQRQKGITQSPTDNPVILKSLLNQAEDLFKLEEFYQLLGRPIADTTLAGTMINAQTMADLFSNQESLAQQLGSWEEVLTSFQAGTLMGFDPLVYLNGDEEPSYYLHTNGQLYALTEDEELARSKSYARVVRNNDGSINRISITDSDVGDWFKELWTGFANGLTSVVDLGGLVFAAGESLVTGDTYGEAYNNYLAWRNAWAPKSNIYQVNQAGSSGDDWAFGFASAAGTIAGFIALNFATMGLGSVSGAVSGGAKVAKAAQSKSLIAKIGRGAYNTTKTLININSGIPFGSKAVGMANVVQRAALNFTVEGAEMFANAKARQTQTGLDDADIIIRSIGYAGLNAGLTVFLNGGTDDMGAFTRLGLGSARKSIKKSSVREIDKALKSTRLGSFLANYPRLLFTGNLVADTLENAVTMNIRTTFYRTGGDFKASDVVEGMFEPQALFSLGFMTMMGAKGFMGSEGLRTYGAIQTSRQVGETFATVRNNLTDRLRIAEQDPTSSREANEIRTILNKFDQDYANKTKAKDQGGEGKLASVAQLEILEDMHVRSIDTTLPQQDSFVTAIFRDVIKDDLNIERAKMQRAVIYLFEQRVTQKSRAYNELLTSATVPGFFKEVKSKVPFFGAQASKNEYSKLYNKAFNAADGELRRQRFVSQFEEELDRLPGGQTSKDAIDHVNKQTKDFDQETKRFIKVESANDEVALNEFKGIESAADFNQKVQGRAKAIYDYYTKQGYSELEAKDRTKQILEQGIVFTIKLHETSGDSGKDQKSVAFLIKIYDMLEKNQDPVYPHIIKVEGKPGEVSYMFTGDMTVDFVQRQLTANKFIKAAMLLNQDALTDADIKAAINVMASINIKLDADAIPLIEMTNIIKQLHDGGVLNMQRIAEYVNKTPELKSYYRNNESTFVNDPLVKYIRSLDVLDRLTSLNQTIAKVGPQRKTIQEYGQVLKELEKYGMLPELLKNGVISEDAYKLYEQRMKQNFPQLLNSLKEERELLISSSTRTPDKVIKYLINKFGDDKTLEIIQVIEKEIMTGTSGTEQLILKDLRQRLGESEFEEIVKTLVDQGIIKENEVNRVPNIDDLLNALRGKLSRSQIADIRKRILELKAPGLNAFVEQFGNKNELKAALQTLGYYKKNKDGTFVRTLKESTYEELIADLETLRDSNIEVAKFLDNIKDVIVQKSEGEMTAEAFKQLYPNIELSDLKDINAYLGILNLSIRATDNQTAKNNVYGFNNKEYNKRIKFYEWLLQGDNLERLYAIDVEKIKLDSKNRDLTELKKFTESIPEEFRLANVYQERVNRGTRFKFIYGDDPVAAVAFARKMYGDILSITKEQQRNNKTIDRDAIEDKISDLEKIYTVTPKQLYEESIRESKGIPTVREDVLNIIEDERITDIIMGVIYDRLNASQFTILEPTKIIDTIIGQVKDQEQLFDEYKTSDVEARKKLLKKKIMKLVGGQLQERTIIAALDKYFQDAEGTGSFYEYAQLKNVKTQTAIELERFYEAYTRFTFDDTNEIETNDIIIHINLEEILPLPLSRIELEMSYQNKTDLTVKDLYEMQTNLNIRDEEIIRTTRNKNKIFKYYNGTNPILEFNITRNPEELKTFLNNFGYDYDRFVRDNYEGIVGISAIKPGARGFLLGDTYFGTKDLRLLADQEFVKNIDEAKQLYIAFHNIVWMDEKTVINPQTLMGSYVSLDDDPEILMGYVNVMYNELLGKLGKAGSLKDGATLSEAFVGLNVEGKVDQDLKNFMMVEWLYNTIDKYVSGNKSISTLYVGEVFNFDAESAKRVERHGWILEKADEAYRIIGYKKPNKIDIKAGERILLNEILPSEFELKPVEVQGILNKMGSTFDEVQNTTMSPSDIAFLKTEYDGGNDVLDRVNAREFTIEFKKDLNDTAVKLPRTNMTVEEVKQELSKPQYLNSTRAIMLLNKLNAATRISKVMLERIQELAPENVDTLKVVKLMQNPEFIDRFVNRLKNRTTIKFTDSDAADLSSGLASLRIPEAYQGDIEYQYNKGFASSRLMDATVFTGEEFRLLNPKADYSDMSLNKEELNFMESALKSVFTDYNSGEGIVRAGQELQNVLASFVFKDSKGQYHLGVGAAESLFMFDYDEQLRQILGDTPVYQRLMAKIKLLRDLYPQAITGIKPDTRRGGALSQVTPTKQETAWNETIQDPESQKEMSMNQLDNRFRSNDIYNAKHKYIKASQAQNRISNEYNNLFTNMMDYQSKLVSTKVSDPSRSMVLNMENQLSTGQMIKTIDDIALTIRENGVIQPFGKAIDDDAIYDLATEIYMLSSNNFKQSEYAKYLIVQTDEVGIKKVQDLNGEMIDDPEGRTEIKKFYASYMKNGEQESLLDLYRTLRELDSDKEYAVFVLDRSEFLSGNKDIDEGAKLSVIKFKEYDRATNESKGYSLFRDMAIEALRVGKDLAGYDKFVMGSAEEYIKIGLNSRLSKMRLIENYKKILRNNTQLNNEQVDALFYTFMDTDVTAPFRSINEEALFRTLHQTTERKLYDVDENNYTKRTTAVIKTGINIDDFDDADTFKLSLFKNYVEHIHKDYVDGIIKGEKVNLKLEDNPEDIKKLSDILYDYMVRGEDLESVKFIVKSLYDENVSLKEYSERRKALIKDASYNGRKLIDIQDYKKVYFDMETVLPNRGVDAETYPFQIGLVYEVNGKIKNTKRINITVDNYKELVNDPNYGDFKSFIENDARGGLRKQINNKDSVSKKQAIKDMITFIEDVRNDDHPHFKDDVLIIAHNGKEADFKWLGQLLNDEGMLDTYLKYQKDFIDTYDILKTYPVLGFNDGNALEQIKYNIDALSDISFLNKPIEELRSNPLFKQEARMHDAMDDAGLLSVIGRHIFRPDSFISMDTINTNILKTFKTITDDLGMNLSNERFFQIINEISDNFKFNVDKDDFTAKVNALPDLKDTEFKLMIDTINDYMLTMDNLYSRKEIYGEFGKDISETAELRKALRNNNNIKLDKIMTYVMSNFKNINVLKTDMTQEEEQTFIKTFNTLFIKNIRNVYGDFNVESGKGTVNNTMFDRFVIQALTDGEDGIERFIKTLNENIPKELIKKDFSIEDLNTFNLPKDSLSKVLQSLEANPESYYNKDLTDSILSTSGNDLLNGLNVINKELLNNITDLKNGTYKNYVLRNFATMLNDNEELLSREYMDNADVLRRLNTVTFNSAMITEIEEMIKTGIPLHQLTMKRYWGLVTAFSKTEKDTDGSTFYKLTNKDGEIEKIKNNESGTIVINKKLFETMFGMNETKYRENLKLKANDPLYLTAIRYPADKIDPLYGYKVKVDYTETSSDFIRMTASDIQRHSGDFDGDKLVLVKPTIQSQEYYSKGMLELMNKPYQALEDLKDVLDNESYFNKAKEKYEARVELSNKLLHLVEDDLTKLKNGANYQVLLDQRIEYAKNFLDSFKDAGYDNDNIKELVISSWIERVDLGFMKLNKEEYIVNNSFLDTNVSAKKAKYLQQKLAFPIINFKDSITGYIQKLFSASTNPNFFLRGKEFNADLLQYRTIQIPSFIKEALRTQIDSNKTEVLINSLRQSIDKDILDELNIETDFSIYKIEAALQLQELKTRLSKEFEDTLQEGLKVKVNDKDISTRNKELVQLYNDMTQGVLDDGWINYGSNYNGMVSRIFENMLRKDYQTRTEMLTDDELIKMVNKQDKYIIIDPNMTEEKGSGRLRKEYAEANPTYRTYSFKVTKSNKRFANDPNFIGIYKGRAYFVEAEKMDVNVKVASIGNEDLFKSTIMDVTEDVITTPKVNGEDINSEDIAMYVSQDAYNKIPTGKLNGEIVKIKALDADGNEVEYDAVKTNLAVVENQKAFPDYYKETDLDMLVFSHSRNTALEPVMFGDVNFKYDETSGKFIIDQSLSHEMTMIRENLKDPVLLASNGTSLYFNLMFNTGLSKILNNVKLNDSDKKIITDMIARHEVPQTFNNLTINRLNTLIAKYFGDTYFKDERTPLERFHRTLNATEKKLFSAELYYKVMPTIVTSVKDYDAMMQKFNGDGVESLIISKSSKESVVQEKGSGILEAPGYNTSDLLLDTSKGVVTQNGFISKLDLLNFFLPEGKQISKNKIKVLTKEGLLERGIGRKGTYESGWQPFNKEDEEVRTSMQSSKGAGNKEGGNYTSPGVAVKENIGSFDLGRLNDFGLETESRPNQDYTPAQERLLKYFNSKKDSKKDTIFRSNYGLLLKRLNTSMKSYDNELDRVQDYNPELPKNVTMYKNPKQLTFDDDGNLDMKYSYAPKFSGTLGEVMKFSNDKSLTSFGYNARNQQDVNSRIGTFEKQIFNELDFTKNEDVTDEFIISLSKQIGTLHKQEVLENEYGNVVEPTNKMKDAVHQPLKGNIIKMKKDILGTSGIGGTGEYDVKLQHVITRLGRDQKMIYADLMSTSSLLHSLLKNSKDVKAFNNYMTMKMFNYLLLETEKDSAQQQTVVQRLQSQLGINTREDLKKEIIKYSNSHRKEAALANVFVTRVHEMGEEVAKETGQVSPKIFQILRPLKDVDNKKNQQQYVHTLKTMFNIGGDIKDSTIDKYLPNTEYDFMHSMDSIVDSIAKVKAAKNLSNNLKEIGSLDNDTFIKESNSIFEDEFSKMIEDPKKVSMRRSLFDHVEAMLGNKFVIDKNSENSLFKLYSQIKKEIASASEGQDYTYKNLDELREYVDKTGDAVARDILIYEELLEDVKYEAVIENTDMQKRILERVRSIAEVNDASLVNEYGQLYPRSMNDELFKPIANFDTSFLLRNLGFIQSGETYNQRMALAAVTGRLYMMDATTAKHLNDNFYTKKKPGRTMEFLNTISSQSTKLIMSSLPQLANRMFNFSMFDYGIMATVDPGYVTKVPRALREFSALMQSNGKVLDSQEYADLNEFIKTVGLNPTKMKGLDIVQFQEKVKTPKFLDGYFQFTDKSLQAQTLATRYALYLHIKESFDNGKGVYGNAYFKKEGIDALPTNAAKAMLVVDETLGSPGAFPFAAKYLQGWAMFATFPLALIRYGVNNTRTIGRVMKDIYMGETDNAGIKQLAKSAVGLTGVALLSNLLVTLVSDIFGVDEETEEEWKKDQVLFKPMQTLLFGRPYVQYGQSANPLQSLEEMLIEPFTAKDNDTLIKKLTGLVNTNILGKLNPVFKIPAEVITNKDFFGPTPISTTYSWEDNLARKFAGYIVGIGGANAMVDSWRYSRVDTEDPTFVDRLGASMKAALAGEIGNNKGYKAELKNYYNAMSIVNGYRSIENKNLYGDQLNSSSFNSDVSFKLASDMRKAMNNEERPSVIYGLINESIQNGAGKNEILYALRSNSIMGRLSQIRNQNDFYAGLTEKERVILNDAALHERKNYSILSELLQETSQSSYSNRYVRNYVPRVYQNTPRDPRYIYNPRYYPPRTPFKPRRQPAQLQRRNMFVPRLSDDTGSRARGIIGKLKVQTSPQSFVGIMDGMAIRKPYQNRIARSLRPRVRAQETPKVFDHRKVFKE